MKNFPGKTDRELDPLWIRLPVCFYDLLCGDFTLVILTLAEAKTVNIHFRFH